MSYLFVAVIGAIGGWIASRYLKGSEMGMVPDVAGGAAGALVAVLLSRVIGPASTGGFVMSAIVALVGGVATLFAMRHVLKEKPAPVVRRRRQSKERL